MKIGLGTASWQNHNGVMAVVTGIKEFLGSEAVLIGPKHPRVAISDGIWLPSRRYSRSDDYFDALLLDSLTDEILRKALRGLDVIHLHSVSALTYRILKVIESLKKRPKVIVHVHTHYLDYSKLRCGEVLGTAVGYSISLAYRYHVHMADMIIFPSAWARDALASSMGLSKDDPRIVVWGAPIKEFAYAEDEVRIVDSINGELNPDTPYLFFAGRLGKEKRLKELLVLFRQIRQHINSQYALVVSGFGDQTPYRREAYRLGIEKNVFFTGPVSEGAVCAYSKGAWAAANCCPNDTQALGPLRGMFCGLPLIAPEGTVLADHIRASGGGVIIEDPQSVTIEEIRSLAGLLLDPAARIEAGSLASLYVAENYSLRQYDVLVGHYERLCA